ncbi:hypothetical protein [Secundilactobacillus kimchicus]|uniref:hypothetical protein n=1 Tax=Secundilactobacillus kimchicus TaxID=528209 RepID=UPI0024A8BB3B|nr:hypothetical protein [Secundilactobacillus kimchicus]
MKKIIIKVDNDAINTEAHNMSKLDFVLLMGQVFVNFAKKLMDHDDIIECIDRIYEFGEVNEND